MSMGDGFTCWFLVLNKELLFFEIKHVEHILNRLVKVSRKSLLNPEGDQSVHKHGRQIYISHNSPPEVLSK